MLKYYSHRQSFVYRNPEFVGNPHVGLMDWDLGLKVCGLGLGLGFPGEAYTTTHCKGLECHKSLPTTQLDPSLVGLGVQKPQDLQFGVQKPQDLQFEVSGFRIRSHKLYAPLKLQCPERS